MSQHKTPLNLDPNFQNWDSETAIDTGSWTFAGTNATEIQLDRRHTRENPKRAIFPSAAGSSDYIYNGRFSWRGEITVAGGSFTLTSNEFAVGPGNLVPSLLLACRQVAGLSLLARVVLAPSIGGVDNAALASNSTIANNTVPRNLYWHTTATTDVNLGADGQAINYWRLIGLQMPEVPVAGISMQVRVEVTDVSATLPAHFDIGELSVVGQGTVIHGVG